MILPATVRYLGQLGEAPSSRGINAVCERVSSLADSLVDALGALQQDMGEYLLAERSYIAALSRSDRSNTLQRARLRSSARHLHHA